MVVANRIASFLLGLVLVVGGLLAIVETVRAATGGEPSLLPLSQWWRVLTTTAWSNPWVLVVSIGVVVVGLAVLLFEAWPRRPQWISANGLSGMTGGRWRVARRTVERHAARAADDVPGVGQTSVRIRGGERRWRVNVSARADQERVDDIRAAVRAELNRLGAGHDVPLRVAAHRPERST